MQYIFLDATSQMAFGQIGSETHYQTFTWATHMDLAARLPEIFFEMQNALISGSTHENISPSIFLAKSTSSAQDNSIKSPTDQPTEAKSFIHSEKQITTDNIYNSQFEIKPLINCRLGVCTGPGSLTGLRVALSFFRSLALVRNLPLIGIDLFTWGARTLESRGVKGKINLLAPAFLGYVFSAEVELPLKNNVAINPTLRQHNEPLAFGPIYGLRFAAEGVVRVDPDPAVLHTLILQSHGTIGFDGLLRVAPLYVVPSKAEITWSQKQGTAIGK